MTAFTAQQLGDTVAAVVARLEARVDELENDPLLREGAVLSISVSPAKLQAIVDELAALPPARGAEIYSVDVPVDIPGPATATLSFWVAQNGDDDEQRVHVELDVPDAG